MTVYAPTDVTSVNIPAERGGCGQSHDAGTLAPGESFVIDCPQCEPHIVGARLGFAHDPIAVALTCDELREVEAAEQSARVEQNRTWSSPAKLRAALFGDQQPAKQPSLLEQIQALGAEDRAVLAAILNPAPAADTKGDDDGSSGKASAEKPAVAKAGTPAKKTTPTAAGK